MRATRRSAQVRNLIAMWLLTLLVGIGAMAAPSAIAERATSSLTAERGDPANLSTPPPLCFVGESGAYREIRRRPCRW